MKKANSNGERGKHVVLSKVDDRTATVVAWLVEHCTHHAEVMSSDLTGGMRLFFFYFPIGCL